MDAAMTPSEDADVVDVKFIRTGLVALLARADVTDRADEIADLATRVIWNDDADSRLLPLYVPAGAHKLLAAGFVPAYAQFAGRTYLHVH